MSNTPKPSTTAATLAELGLSQNEAILYEILLKTAEATIPGLLKTTPFSRTLLYYILGNLEAYGLITSAKVGSKTAYSAEPPEKLAEMVAENEKDFQKQKDLLKNVMGDLYSTYRLAHNKPGVKFFEGPEGIKEVTFDSLKATKVIYTFLDIEAIQKYAPEVNKNYVAERIKRGIFKKQVCLDTPFARERYKILPPKDRLLEVRFIKRETNPFKTGLQIYDDTISYSTLTPDKQIGVIISDANIAAMQRSLFEYIWDTLPPLHELGPTPPPADSPRARLNAGLVEDAPKNNTVFRSPDSSAPHVPPGNQAP